MQTAMTPRTTGIGTHTHENSYALYTYCIGTHADSNDPPELHQQFFLWLLQKAVKETQEKIEHYFEECRYAFLLSKTQNPLVQVGWC